MSAELRLATPAASTSRSVTPVPDTHLRSAHHPDTAPPASNGYDIENTVAANLSRLRALHHLSLDGLARKSGVSRAMLAQIESGRSVPTIRVLQRVAAALQVSVAAFLRNFAPQGVAVLSLHESPRLVSGNGHFSSRSLHPGGERRFEFHELKIDALSTEHLNTARTAHWKCRSMNSASCWEPAMRFFSMPTSPTVIAIPPTRKRLPMS
jgi:transcriptional regulator with XRE-family HTH domain